MAFNLELAQLALRNQAKPHWLCKDIRGDVWEYISYPYILGGKVAVKIRVPGDPTSMITADALLLDPEGKECLCAEAGKDFYLAREYYRARHARLTECPALLSEGRWRGSTRKRIRFSREELEAVNDMCAIASAACWGEGDYMDWDNGDRAIAFDSLRKKVWALIARADGLPDNFELAPRSVADPKLAPGSVSPNRIADGAIHGDE
jgi:hypothetical protein